MSADDAAVLCALTGGHDFERYYDDTDDHIWGICRVCGEIEDFGPRDHG